MEEIKRKRIIQEIADNHGREQANSFEIMVKRQKLDLLDPKTNKILTDMLRFKATGVLRGCVLSDGKPIHT